MKSLSEKNNSDFHQEEFDPKLLDRFYKEECSPEEIALIEEWFVGLKYGKEVYQRAKTEWNNTSSTGSQKDILQTVLYKIHYKLRIENFSKEKAGIKTIRLKRMIASVAIGILLLLSGFWFGNIGTSGLNNVYSELHAPYGSRLKFELPDGSKGWLNSGSSLKFPIRFTGRKRLVSLEGEGYFNVKHNPRKPFIVQTNNSRIIAVGTSFDVQAFKKDGGEEVTLVKGKVVVEKKLMGNKYKHLWVMNPGEHIRFDIKTGKITALDKNTKKYVAWKDGALVFRNDPLSRVIKEMGHFYNVEIMVYNPQFYKYHFHATFEDETLFEALRLLTLSSDMNYKICKREKNPDGTYKKRKVILYKKDS